MIIDNYWWFWWFLIIIDNYLWLLMINLLCYISIVYINVGTGTLFFAQYLEN